MEDLIKVLIVDDDVAFAKIVQMRVKSWREQALIKHCTSLTEARETLAQSKDGFELVILDQHLPDGIGFELLQEEGIKSAAVLSISSDDAPELPAENVKKGAQHFLSKRQVSSPVFVALIEAVLERKAAEKDRHALEAKKAKFDAIKTLLATLRHEINNPLGAVLGATYLLKHEGQLDDKQVETIKLIESSGQRINHVLMQLCEAAELEEVTKGQSKVFHVPGDKPWE